ncbi:GNAT family N-acetyltransferase [Planctobacterium marinum]|uniref:N-acetyltransferase domain-containing protein n=1 Tax=Planctobacterium marinum TaxID=1631968 RepID=A0AA48KTM9_9ALTE|nr:hypothetical protein MACH26_10910 [Planctobacterium marinum]
MKFRAATADDIPELLELEQAVVEAERPFNGQIKPGRPKYYDLAALIEQAQSYLLVAEINNEIAATGYVKLRDSKPSLNHARDGYLGFMYVAPDYRGQGLNQKVISHLIDWAKEQGVHDFYLDVYTQNQAAIKAYAKLGFEPSLLEMKLQVR